MLATPTNNVIGGSSNNMCELPPDFGALIRLLVRFCLDFVLLSDFRPFISPYIRGFMSKLSFIHQTICTFMIRPSCIQNTIRVIWSHFRVFMSTLLRVHQTLLSIRIRFLYVYQTIRPFVIRLSCVHQTFRALMSRLLRVFCVFRD